MDLLAGKRWVLMDKGKMVIVHHSAYRPTLRMVGDDERGSIALFVSEKRAMNFIKRRVASLSKEAREYLKEKHYDLHCGYSTYPYKYMVAVPVEAQIEILPEMPGQN